LAEVAEIDCLNILGATKMAMLRAVENLNIIPDNILVDGNRPPKFPVPFLSIIKGDTLSFSIAAASIIAKVTRDRIMDGLHQEFPAFGWNKNRGYGTAAHQKAITDHGITIHHRRHFRYVREVYEQA
jgi:ribonuclease HII